MCPFFIFIFILSPRLINTLYIRKCQFNYVCVCLDFLKPKTRINKKVDKKMCLVEPKTQLFKKSCVLGSAKIQVRNALNLWTSEVHKSKRAAGFWTLLPLDVAFTKMPLIYLTQTHKLISSLTLTYLISLLFTPHALTPTPPSLTCISTLCSALYSVVSFFLFFFLLSSSSSMRF